MKSDYPFFLAGDFKISGQKLPVTEKYENQVFAQTWLAGREHLEQAILAGVNAETVMKNLSSVQKYEILHEVHQRIKEQRQQLAEILCKESAKPMRYAIAEIDRASHTFLVAAEESKRLPKEYISLDWTENGRNREGLVKYFPIGLVAGISPFNFPLNLAVHKIAPAIAAGCPIILKPASSTPLSTLALAEIIAQTTLPKGALSILPMDRKTGNYLVNDNRVKMLSFTGSPEVGWEMKKNAGKKKVVLELGGNAGVIVTDSADLEDAVRKSLIGAFSYSGQICIHAQRFFVHDAIFEKFRKAMSQGAKLLKFGNPLKPETEISDMIDEENARRIELWINEAKLAGAKLLCGGKRTGKFVEPSLLTGCNNNMKVYSEEAFGPVACIEPYGENIEQAIDLVNKSKYGLQCGVFTNSVTELDKCFSQLEVGGVIHNDVPTLRFDHMPYGGIKESGLGREGVRYAIQEMMEPKILVK